MISIGVSSCGCVLPHDARVVVYADDLVILTRGFAHEAHEVLRHVMGRIGLTVNETKTKLRKARDQSGSTPACAGAGFPGVYLRSLLGPQDREALPRGGTLPEECEAYQGEGPCRNGAQCAALAGGLRRSRRDVERVAGILQLWHAETGLQRAGRSCRKPHPSLPQTPPQGPLARITAVLDRARL